MEHGKQRRRYDLYSQTLRGGLPSRLLSESIDPCLISLSVAAETPLSLGVGGGGCQTREVSGVAGRAFFSLHGRCDPGSVNHAK